MNSLLKRGTIAYATELGCLLYIYITSLRAHIDVIHMHALDKEFELRNMSRTRRVVRRNIAVPQRKVRASKNHLPHSVSL